MRIAVVGGGYVADMYLQTLPAYPQLQVAGVWDRDPTRLQQFTSFHSLHAYASLAELLADPDVELVVNLTNPRSHVEVTTAALEAGKHVYSEKPLALDLDDAERLVELATSRGLALAAAPCNYLSAPVAELARLLSDPGRALGRPLLAHAELDDGMVSEHAPETWRSISGAPWPVRDEFEVGCTIEHAGYQLGPLVTLFGPVRHVTAFSAALLPEKVHAHGGQLVAADLSIGVLELDDGVVARITNSVLAPADRSLRIVCEKGVLALGDVWDYAATLRYSDSGMSTRARVARKVEERLSPWAKGALLGRRLRLPDAGNRTRTQGGHRMDFARGVAHLADAVLAGDDHSGQARLALHVTEVTLALHHGTDGRVAVTSTL